MRRKALFIGVNKYTNGLPELSCAANDATVLQEFFEDCGYETCILRNADTNSILSAIEEQTKDLKRSDVFLFFFAGHGYTVENADQSLDRRLAGRTDRHNRIMSGQDGIRLDEIRQSVSETHCSCVIIMDACQSMVNTRRGEGMVREACTARDLQAITNVLSRGDRVGSDNGFVVINSCQEGDVAYELNEENHGLFTLALLDVIRQMRHNGENAAFDESFTQKVALQMAVRSRGRFSQRPAYLPDRRSLNRIRVFPTAEEINERHRLNEEMRMEEQRRIAAIRAKEEQLAKEEKRIREESARQEAILAERQKQIEEERLRQDQSVRNDQIHQNVHSLAERKNIGSTQPTPKGQHQTEPWWVSAGYKRPPRTAADMPSIRLKNWLRDKFGFYWYERLRQKVLTIGVIVAIFVLFYVVVSYAYKFMLAE